MTTKHAETEALQRHFIIGSDAPLTLAQCPKEWQTILENAPAADLALSALAMLSSYQNTLEMPTPEGALTRQANFPPLPLPEVPSKWHYFIVELIDLYNDYYFVALLHFLQRRGYVIAPHLWQKETHFHNDYPAVYHPWRAWFADKNDPTFADDKLIDAPICADNWDDFYPAARRDALRELRRRDPAAARELIASCAAREKAEQRLEIIELLQEKLSSDDAPFLHSLENDRSKKIQESAQILLAQIEPPTQEMINEQIALIKKHFVLKDSAGKGKKHVLQTKNKAQYAYSFAWLQMVSLARFAEAFSVSEQEIIAAWDWFHHSHFCNTIFARKLIQTNDADVLEAFINKMLAHHYRQYDVDYYSIGEAFRQLDPKKQQAIFLGSLREKRLLNNVDLVAYLLLIAPPLEAGQLSFAEFKESRLWYLLTLTKKDKNEARLLTIYQGLGFFVSQDLARELEAHLPPLCMTTMVTFNAQLEPAAGK